MVKRRIVTLAVAVLSVLVVVSVNLAQRQTGAPTVAVQSPRPALAVPKTVQPAAGMSVESQEALTKQYCSGCHNDKSKAGGMAIAQMDFAHAEKTSWNWPKKIIRKLRVRPDASRRNAAPSRRCPEVLHDDA